jgi:hypothetical protein
MEDFFCNELPSNFSSPTDSLSEEHINPVNTILKETMIQTNKQTGQAIVLSPSRDYLANEKENYSDPVRVFKDFLDKKRQGSIKYFFFP